jgi:hypothetical protein
MFNLLSELDFELGDAPSQRRQNLRQASGIGLDNGREIDIALNHLRADGIDRQFVPQRRAVRNDDSPSVSHEQRCAFTRWE